MQELEIFIKNVQKELAKYIAAGSNFIGPNDLNIIFGYALMKTKAEVKLNQIKD